MLRCDTHHVPLRFVGTHHSGKPVYRCPYSHSRYFKSSPRQVCKKCKDPDAGVHSEGLCYPCFYYRHP